MTCGRCGVSEAFHTLRLCIYCLRIVFGFCEHCGRRRATRKTLCDACNVEMLGGAGNV